MVWNRWHVDVSARYDRIVSQQVSDTGDLKPPFRRPYQRPRLAVVRPGQRSVALPELQPAITPAMLPGADGKPLKPTTAEQVEAGLKFQPPGSSDLYSIAIYDLTQRMSPLATRTSPPPPIFRRVRSIPGR